MSDQQTTAVNPTDLAIAACNTVMRSLSYVPIVLQTGRLGNYHYTRTPAGQQRIADQWSVRLIPCLHDVCVSGSGQYLFGVNDNIGKTAVVTYADYEGGVTGAAFLSALHDTITAKAAEVAADRDAR
jgi:hypothetical protein